MQLVIREGEAIVFAMYGDEVADVAGKHAALGPLTVVSVPDATCFLYDATGRALDPRTHPAPPPP